MMHNAEVESKVSGNGQRSSVLARARSFVAAGISVIPIRADGAKAPSVKWTPYQERRPTDAELVKWFASGRQGIATINGKVSGNLETMDFDRGALLEPWRELLNQRAPGLYERLNVCRTPRQPNGYHVRYRCPGITIPGNTDLAQAQEADPETGAPLVDDKGRPKVKATIQTRGEGGYSLAPGTPGHCHPTGGTYEHISGPPLTELSDVTPEEYEILWTAARSLNQWVDRSDVADGPSARATDRGLLPGDDFNRRGPDFLEIMQPHGWSLARQDGAVRYLRRPGKDEPGHSATIGFCKSDDGVELLAVFSTSAQPLEVPTGKVCGCYSRFAVYALLNHNGDFKAAAKDLAQQGYGDQRHRTNGKPTGAKPTGTAPDEFSLGAFTLRPLSAHRTKGGKLSVVMTVHKAGQPIDNVQVPSSTDGRKKAAEQLARHLAGDTAALAKVEAVIGELIAWGLQALERPPAEAKSNVLEIVRRRVPEKLGLRARADGGLWSEAQRAMMARQEFLSFTPGWLLDEVAAACGGSGDPLAWLGPAQDALKVVWAEQQERLPDLPYADLGPDSGAGERWRWAFKKLFKVTDTWDKPANGPEIFSRANLITRAWDAHNAAKASFHPQQCYQWRPILKSVDAWWRPHLWPGETKPSLLLAMRFALTFQVKGCSLPGVHDQATLTALGVKFGCIDPDPPVSANRNGRQRLAVLSRELTQELLEDPAQWSEDPDISMTPEGGCH
jgi:putative DNA primase/helicase